MRLLHVSDWHLGSTLGRVRRVPDHDEVLEQIVGIAREFSPHLVVHTGDLFDHGRPGVEELERGVDVLRRLSEASPVVVIAGNHDSPALFDIFDRLLALGARAGRPPVRFIGRARPPRLGGILTIPGEDSEEIRVAPVPFIHANELLEVFDATPERWTATYTDKVRDVEEALGQGLTDNYDASRQLLVFAAHLHVGGARFSGSERPLHVTDSYATAVEHLPAVTYAAFGHIHRPQALPGGLVRGRYAGSPIPIDYGEMGEAKSVVCVDARPGQVARIEVVPLSGGRPLIRRVGTLEALAATADTVGRAILAVIVETEEPTPGLADRVVELFPKATIFDVVERCRTAIVEEAVPQSADEEPPVRDLFHDYLERTGTPAARVDRLMALFEQLLDAAEASETAVLDEEQLFALPGAEP